MRWSEAIAVGSFALVENVQTELGSKAMLAQLKRKTESMHCVNRVRLTTVISAVKVNR
jgi:hypothetical protein